MSAKDWFESIPSPFDKPAATGSREPRKMVSRYSQTIHDEDGNCAGASCTPLVPTPPAIQPTVIDTLARAIGNVCDRWEMMPNDLKGYLREQNENFCRALDALLRAAEQK